MNTFGAYTITGNLSLIILSLAFIGAITVIVILFKIIAKLSKIIIKPKKNITIEKNVPKYSSSTYFNKTIDEYLKSTYYLSTHLSLNAVKSDKGRYGEYTIFKVLQTQEHYGGRFLFNCYLPKDNNQTTEIDIILLTLNGIFVFESKNYNGWIYGSEHQEFWTQTLPAGNKIHKEHFYNPIMQNKSHIKSLKKLIGDTYPIYSIVVFSYNCKLKNISASDPMTKIVSINDLNSAVTYLLNQRPNSLTQDTLISIYNQLYPYTQVSEEVKRKHAEDIQAKKQE